jgi:hypothetical protein
VGKAHPALHAFTDCDTNSVFVQQGQLMALKILTKAQLNYSEHLENQLKLRITYLRSWSMLLVFSMGCRYE